MTDDRTETGEGARVGKNPRREAMSRFEARCQVLEEALADVEADNRELRTQLSALTETCERLTAGEDRGGPPVRLPTFEPPPSGAARIRRLARSLVQFTVGTARRLWQAGDPGLRWVVAARPTATEAAALPSISIVVTADPDRVAVGPPPILQGTPEGGIELAVWDADSGGLEVWPAGEAEVARITARSRDELLEALAGEWLMVVPPSVTRLSAGLIDDLRLLVATEPLQYVRVPLRPRDLRHADGDVAELLLTSREVFDPARLIDVDRLEGAARSHPVLGKTVRMAGPVDAASPRPVTFGGHARGAVVAVGRYELWARNRSGPVEHRVASVPIPDVAGANGDFRRSVVVVASAPLDGGVDRLVGGLLHNLGDEFRVHLVTTSSASTLGLNRTAFLEHAGAEVHELGTVLDPSAWPAAVVRIAERCAARTVLLVGWDGRLAAAATELRARGLRLVAVVIDETAAAVPADLWLAASVTDAEALVAAGVSEDRVELAPLGTHGLSARRPGGYGRDRAIRSMFGVPDGHRLVLTVGDLVPRCRPEDVVLVADRLRDEEALQFLLVGEGPLTGQVADLAAYLGLANVSVQPPGPPSDELVAAADVVLDPSDSAPSRPAVEAALAFGKPVVATAGGGLDELLGSSVVSFVGDLEALADALRRVIRGAVPTVDPAAARELMGLQAEGGIEAVRRVLLDVDAEVGGS